MGWPQLLERRAVWGYVVQASVEWRTVLSGVQDAGLDSGDWVSSYTGVS